MSNRTNLVRTLGLLLALIAVAPNLDAANNTVATSTPTISEPGKLSVVSVKKLLDEKTAVYIFDANGHDSYIDGHVPGAQWIEYDAVAKAGLPKAKDAMLVFYCYNPMCGASPRAAKDAIRLGYSNVWVMPEGIVGWRTAKMPIVTGLKAL